jgi:hypothetical protein
MFRGEEGVLIKSHSPLALSVVSVTQPGDAVATAGEILMFDDRKFGFSHDKTWAAMPAALRGLLRAERVRSQLGNLPTRVASAIATLCALGEERPVDTYAFHDHPGAGLRHVEGLLVGPGVTVRARASCWYVRSGIPVIPILQPRKAELGTSKLGMYAALARRAFCKRDWTHAEVEIVDLSGDDGDRRVLTEAELRLPSEEELNGFISTYVEAQAIAAGVRANRAAPEKQPTSLPLYEPSSDRASGVPRRD